MYKNITIKQKAQGQHYTKNMYVQSHSETFFRIKTISLKFLLKE